ncbi:MAG: glycosyltransferase family 9 protein [Phycisphaerales bacterium]
MQTFERILIIRPSALGDVARSVPVLVSLRDAFPNARIDWLVQDSFAEVIAAHPALSNVVKFPRADFGRWTRTLNLPALSSFLSSLRRPAYDLVLDCQGLARSGLFAAATRARFRVGHADARELGWLGYTRRVPCSIETHTVDRMLSLVEAIGVRPRRDADAMRLYVPAAAAGFAASLGLSRYAVLAPTSRWPGKQWPADRFAALARELSGDGTACVVVGAGSERSQITDVLALTRPDGPIVDLVGKTSLGQLMDVVSHAACVVANDSAALHIAVGFARPTVALFGPTRVNRVGPYGRERDVIQHVEPGDGMDHKNEVAGRGLMARITLAEVLDATRARLTATA